MSFPSFVSIPSISLFDGQLILTGETIVTVLANIIIMLVLTFFTSHTKMGKAMRAVSEDRSAAELMGIKVNATISLTFAIGSALAAIAGVLLCSTYHTLMPTTGSIRASRRSRRLFSAASDQFPARCWAACCWASLRFSARRMCPWSWATRWVRRADYRAAGQADGAAGHADAGAGGTG